MSRPPEPPVIVGVIGKALGLRGDVYVHPDPDIDEAFEPGRSYRVRPTPAAGVEAPAGPERLTVAASRLHRGRRVVRFEGVGDRTRAEGLRGLALIVARAQIGLAADAFWAAELVGREVVDQHGRRVGLVAATRDGPAHDYLLVGLHGGGEALVPAVPELVEVTGDRVVVQAIPGLLDEG